MIDKYDKCRTNCCLYNIMMEQCSHLCIRRTLFAVMIGVSPIVICLVFIGLARLILYRLEIAYYRRQKGGERRMSVATSQSGRLALSYTPVSHAELQRIIQGKYQSRQVHDSSLSSTSTNLNTRKTPRFIKSILPRREPPLTSAGILANLVVRRDAIDAGQMPTVIVPIEEPLQPTFTIINEHERRRPSLITIKRESVETMTLATMQNNDNNNCFCSSIEELAEPESGIRDPLKATTKTMTTTTTVVVEEFLEFHSASSLPCTLSFLSTVAENDDGDDDDDIDSETNNNND